MYCPKCKHTSFDHLATCPRCGYDWQSIRTALNLNWLQSSGHEWLPEAALETVRKAASEAALEATPDAGMPATPTPAEKPEESTLSPETARLGTAVETDDIFAFEKPEVDGPSSVPASPLEKGPAPLLSQTELEEELEVKLEGFSGAPPPLPSSGTLPDAGARGVPTDALEARLLSTDILSVDTAVDEPAQVASIVADDHDAASLNHFELDESTVAPSSVNPKSTDEALPVWEIELPHDLLPQEYFPEPAEQERGSMGTDDEAKQEILEVSGDLAFDFSEVEVVLPDLDEGARPPVSRDDASPPPGATHGDDAQDPSAPLSPSSSDEPREGR